MWIDAATYVIYLNLNRQEKACVRIMFFWGCDYIEMRDSLMTEHTNSQIYNRCNVLPFQTII